MTAEPIKQEAANAKMALAKAKSNGNNSNLSAARGAKNDEFYTQWADIEREMNAYLEYRAEGPTAGPRRVPSGFDAISGPCEAGHPPGPDRPFVGRLLRQVGWPTLGRDKAGPCGAVATMAH